MTVAPRSGSRRLTSVVWWRDALLSVGAVLGSVCIVVALAGALFDVRTLVFRSGSMSPEIRTGALALARQTPASDLAVGDVVSVVAANGTRITHRVHSVTMTADGRAELVLKGDANSRPDEQVYTTDSADRVFLDVPYLGYAVGLATSPAGLVVGGLLATGLLWVVLRPSGGGGGAGPGGARSDTRAGATGQRGGRRRAGAGTVAMVAAVGVATQAPVSTLAYFSDSGTVQTGPLPAHAVVSQTAPSCTNVNGVLVLGNVARLSWSKSDSRYEYAWELRTLAGAVVSSGTVGGSQAAGATVSLDVGTALLSTSANFNVAVRARLKASTTWVASTETVTPVRSEGIVVVGLSMRCGHA
ncbi:MAG: signal peptidase [Aeromicrobium sp.]|nr:signal peptidase [Aeromicrobium sp.]